MLPSLSCGSIVVIVEGEAFYEAGSKTQLKHISRGDIFYIPPSTSVTIKSILGNRLSAYRTFSYEEGPDHSNRTVVPVIPHKAPIAKKHRPDIIPFGKEKKVKSLGADIFDVESEMDGFCWRMLLRIFILYMAFLLRINKAYVDK